MVLKPTAICYTFCFLFVISFKSSPIFDHHHINLPHVCTHLYWSFNPTDSTLRVNFKTSTSADAVAPPPTGVNGSRWIAWGINPINPTETCSQLDQVVVLSLDPQRSFVVETYNFSSPRTIWVRESSFEFGLMEFDARVSLPEKTESITHVVMSGTSSGKPNLNDADMKLFEVLNPKEAEQSFLSSLVDGFFRAFIFEKGCTRERKMIWDEYLTLNNYKVALCYVVLLLILFSVEVKLDKWYFWKLFGISVALNSLTIMYILTTKAYGVLTITGWNSFSAGLYAHIAFSAVFTATTWSVYKTR